MGYTGDDRRGGARAPARRITDHGCVAALGAVALATLLPDLPGTETTGLLAAGSPAMASLRVSVCAVGAGLCLLHWRDVSGAAASVLLAMAFVLLGPVAGGVAQLAHATSDRVASSIPLAATVVAIGLLLLAVWTPPIDDRVRPVRVALWSLVATAAAATALVVVAPPGVLAVVADGHLTGGLDALLLVAAVAYVVWSVGWEVHAAVTAQRAELLVTRISRDLAEARAEAVRVEAEERAHEARNALMAIEAATRTLERHHDRLPAETRAEIADAVVAEVAQLQRLVTAADGARRSRPFQVVDALAGPVTMARAHGVHVELRVDDSPAVAGDLAATSQVLHNLLENVRRHAPGSPVCVDAGTADARVLLRVTDDGPGIPAEWHEQVFERGFRGGTSAEGDGLGLHIARRLMRRQGGDLWVEEGTGSGATMIVALPAAPASADPPDGAPAIDLRDEVVEAPHEGDHRGKVVRGPR